MGTGGHTCERCTRGTARYAVLIHDLRPPDVKLGTIERWYTGLRLCCEECARSLFTEAAASEAVIEEIGDERFFRDQRVPEDMKRDAGAERQRRRRDRVRLALDEA